MATSDIEDYLAELGDIHNSRGHGEEEEDSKTPDGRYVLYIIV